MLKKVAKSVDLVVKSLQQRTFFRRVASLTLKNSSPDGRCLLPHPPEFKRARSRSSCWYDCWHPRCCITPERELEAAMESINSTTIPTVHKEPTARKRVSLAAHPSLHLLTLFFLPSQPNRVPQSLKNSGDRPPSNFRNFRTKINLYNDRSLASTEEQRPQQMLPRDRNRTHIKSTVVPAPLLLIHQMLPNLIPSLRNQT